MDGVGAGEGEIVMCVGGSSSRAADETKTAPADMTLLAILDSIDIKDAEYMRNTPRRDKLYAVSESLRSGYQHKKS